MTLVKERFCLSATNQTSVSNNNPYVVSVPGMAYFAFGKCSLTSHYLRLPDVLYR